MNSPVNIVTLERDGELWEISWIGNEVEIARGPQRAEPEVEERFFPDPREAEAFARSEITARRSDGWVDSGSELDASTADPEPEPVATERAWAMRRRDPGDEREPVTRVGGRPLAPRLPGWPSCSQCERPMQFLAQVRLSDLDDRELGDGLLLIWHCDELGRDCAPFEHDTGCNLALVCDLSPDLELLAIPTGERRHRVLDRTDGIELIAIDRPIEWDDAIDDPYFTIRTDGAGEIVGMLTRRPDWIQDTQIPSCRDCRRSMRPVVQLEHTAGGGINFGDVGCGYGFVCTGCRAAAFLMQCH